MAAPLTPGAVAYDPKVVTIWDGFRSWLRAHGFPFDYVMYSHCERQVTELLAGRVDIAWNSPLALVRARRLASANGQQVRAVAMCDTDRDLRSVIVVRTDSPVTAPVDLAGHVIGTGAVDSPRATLLPLDHLRSTGLRIDRCRVEHFDIGTGLHGDHIGGERAAVEALRTQACSTASGRSTTFPGSRNSMPRVSSVQLSTASLMVPPMFSSPIRCCTWISRCRCSCWKTASSGASDDLSSASYERWASMASSTGRARFAAATAGGTGI
ncbi:phosphate/phosphite/phosphonate ABC transporter substrate-binding protein [Streptomyces sp. NPDC002742]|uniref:phosphate/phosphite/phosphonate ABC transporter substrate-binding protein n=1 Tax=Streptomyces sp. NPDC002742 TaxID=3364663 RepID=UPI0036CC1D0E